MSTLVTQQVAVVLLQLLAFILASLAVACVPWIYTHVRNRTVAGALAWLANVAALAVGAGAGAVRDLKDPSKPGAWTPEAAQRFRAAAMNSVFTMGREALGTVRRSQGLSAAGVEQLVEQLVEATVEAQRRGSLVLPVPVPSVLRGPTIPARVPAAPAHFAAAAAFNAAGAAAGATPTVPRPATARGQEGRAAVGALLTLVMVTAACSGGALAAAGAAADTASSVILVARKVRAALCSATLDPYLGAVRERVVVVHDVDTDGGAAVDAAAGE